MVSLGGMTTSVDVSRYVACIFNANDLFCKRISHSHKQRAGRNNTVLNFPSHVPCLMPFISSEKLADSDATEKENSVMAQHCCWDTLRSLSVLVPVWSVPIPFQQSTTDGSSFFLKQLSSVKFSCCKN